MIAGHLSNIRDEMRFYPAALQKGLKYLLDTDFSAMAPGRYEIEGSKIYAMLSEYETQPKEKRRPEAHVKYLDIQYIVSGEEIITSGPLAAAGEVIEDRLAEKDAIFYKAIAAETELKLMPGMFAVYFPWDVHRPNCQAGDKAGKVRKVVVKVAMDAL